MAFYTERNELDPSEHPQGRGALRDTYTYTQALEEVSRIANVLKVLCVCMCVYVCVYAHVHLLSQEFVTSFTHPLTYSYTHTHTHAHTHIHTHSPWG